MFENLTVAANIAGINIEEMTEHGIAALRNMKMPALEASQLIKGIAGSAGEATKDIMTSLPRIVAAMANLGMTSKDSYEKTITIQEELGKQLGNNAQAAQYMDKIMREIGSGEGIGSACPAW